MGEHADGGDREDEESAAAPSDDSPETNDERETVDSSEERDGEGEESEEEQQTGGTADSPDDATDSETGTPADEDDTTADDEGPDRDRYHEPDLSQSLPSADEWLEEHGGADEAPGMDMDAGDGVVDDEATADPDDAADVEDGDREEEPKGTHIGEPVSSDAVDEQKTLAERGYEHETSADSDDESDEGESDEEIPAEAGTDDGGTENEGTDDEGTDDGISIDAMDDEALARDARERAQASLSDEDGEATADDEEATDDGEHDDEDVATAEPPVSTSDPGKNAPAGMGKPTPAGGGGGGTATGSGSGGTTSFPDFDEDMAPDDQEQPLADHIEEMTHRFLVVVLVMGLVGTVALLWSDDMINFLWYSFLGPDDGTCPGPQCPLQWRPHVYHPLSLLLARLKVAALVGFVAGLPVAVYQTYRFMRPGLYPHERRYYLAAVPTSLVLAVGGVGFAYFVVLPSLFIYFSAYSTQAAELAFALSDTFDLMVMMLGFFALIFQIPLLVMLAIMMGVVTRRWLEQRRVYFWTGFAGVAFIFSPDPTGMAPLIVAITMVALFEGTLLLLRWTERSVALFSAKSLEARRPYAWALAAVAGYVVSAAPVPEGYYDLLPPVVTETLANYGYTALTPAFIAIGIIAVFELLGWIARRIGAGQGVRQGLQVRLAFIRARPAVWLLAIVVGYAGSPDPVILDVFRDVNVAPPIAVGVVVGLIVAYEGLRLVLSYVRPE